MAFLCSGPPAAAQAITSPSIISPADGQVLQGSVPVRVATDMADFASAELDFTYRNDPTESWFLIQGASLPESNDVMAVWDTTSISDGDYTLRLRVVLLDGSIHDVTAGVQVRNYTATPTVSPALTPTAVPVVEIPTAMIIAASQTPLPPTVVPPATPSPMPPNPAGVTVADVYAGLWRGALIISVLVIIVVVLVRFRRY